MRTELLELEEGFWKALREHDAEFYRAHLADDSLTVGPLGEFDKDTAISLLGKGGESCPDRRTGDERFVRLTDDCGLLAYRVTLSSGTDDCPTMIERHVVSVYVWRGGQWLAAYRMQLPVPAGES